MLFHVSRKTLESAPACQLATSRILISVVDTAEKVGDRNIALFLECAATHYQSLTTYESSWHPKSEGELIAAAQTRML